MHRSLAPFLVLALSLAGLAYLSHIENRVEMSEQLLKEHLTQPRSFVKITTADGNIRVFPKMVRESAQEWAARVRRVMEGTEHMQDYICETLVGCSGGSTVEVCTPCVGLTTQECRAQHRENVQAFCREFRCSGC